MPNPQQHKLERRTASIDIYPGDYLDRIRHLERRAEALKKAHQDSGGKPQLLGEVPEFVKVAREHDELVAEAEANKITVQVKALPRKTWKALVGQHPPRPGSDDDERAGVNEDDFKDALVTTGSSVTIDGREVSYRTIISPSWMTDEDLEELSDIDFDRIYLTAFAMNRAPAGAPGKASLASRTTQPSGETSS